MTKYPREVTLEKDTKWFMAGTEGTGEYVVAVAGNGGRIGYRHIDGGWRVRVEPANDIARKMLRTLLVPADWKQPGDQGQDRFSCVVRHEFDMRARVATAIAALQVHEGIEVNPAAPGWVAEGIASTAKVVDKAIEGAVAQVDAHALLLKEAKALRLKGANVRWSAETLRQKIKEAKGG